MPLAWWCTESIFKHRDIGWYHTTSQNLLTSSFFKDLLGFSTQTMLVNENEGNFTFSFSILKPFI